MNSQVENPKIDGKSIQADQNQPVSIKREEEEADIDMGGVKPHEALTGANLGADHGGVGTSGQNGQNVQHSQDQQVLQANAQGAPQGLGTSLSSNSTSVEATGSQSRTKGSSFSIPSVLSKRKRTPPPQEPESLKAGQNGSATIAKPTSGSTFNAEDLNRSSETTPTVRSANTLKPVLSEPGPKRARFESPILESVEEGLDQEGLQEESPESKSYMNSIKPPPEPGMRTIGWVSYRFTKSYVNLYGTERLGSYRIQDHKDEFFTTFEENEEHCFSRPRNQTLFSKYTKEDVADVLGVAWPQDEDRTPQENLTLLDPRSPNFATELSVYVIIQWKHLKDPTNPNSGHISAVPRSWWRRNIKEPRQKRVHKQGRIPYYYPPGSGKDRSINQNGWSDNELFKIAFRKEKEFFEAANPGRDAGNDFAAAADREPSPIDDELAAFREASMGPNLQPAFPAFQEAASVQRESRNSIPPAPSRMSPGSRVSPGNRMSPSRDATRFETPQRQFRQASRQLSPEQNAPEQVSYDPHTYEYVDPLDPLDSEMDMKMRYLRELIGNYQNQYKELAEEQKFRHANQDPQAYMNPFMRSQVMAY